MKKYEIKNYDDYRKFVNVERLDNQIKDIKKDIDVEQEVDTLFKFFKLLYPKLDELNKYKKINEILQIALFYVSPKLNKNLKGNTRGQIGVSSYSDTQVESFLKSEINRYFYSVGAYNVYYSLGLSLQYMKNKSYDPYATKEEKFINKNIDKQYIRVYRNNNNNTLYLGALAIDIDASTLEELAENIKKCNEVEEKLKINSIKINTSLLGQQRVYLLDKPYTNKDLLNQFMKAFYESGINVDKKVKDISRVLRLPIGLNVKCYDPSKNHIKDVFKVEWINKDEEINRYTPDFLIGSLKSLKTRDFIDIEELKENKISIKRPKKTQRNLYCHSKEDIIQFLKERLEESKLDEKYFKSIYNCLSYEELPESILKMFSFEYHTVGYASIGYRNSILRVLNYYLDFIYPLSLTEAQKRYILSSWGNSVKLENKQYQIDYVRENKQYLKPNDPEIIEIFGEIDFSIYKKGGCVYISNMLIDKFKYLKGNSFSLFLKILIHESDNGIRQYIKEDLIEITKISSRSIERYLNDLVKTELVIKRKSRNRKEGDKTEYYINPKYRDFTYGYERIRAIHIENDLEKLKQNELKVYYYLLLKSDDNGFRKSKRNMAEDLNINHSSITKITNKLEELSYIRKVKEGEGFYQLNKYLIR